MNGSTNACQQFVESNKYLIKCFHILPLLLTYISEENTATLFHYIYLTVVVSSY